MTLFTRESLTSHTLGGFHTWPGLAALFLMLLVGLLLSVLPVTWAVFIFITATVLLLALIQPMSALALALLAGPFGALESVILGGMSVDSGQLLLLLALAAWISRSLISRQFSIPRSPLTIPLLIFIGVAAITLVSAVDTVLGIKEVVKWMEVLAVMLMVSDMGRQLGVQQKGGEQPARTASTAGIAWVVVMLMAAGVVQAAIGIWQFMLRGDGPEHFLVLGCFYRAYGTFEQPNPFGGYMNLTALLALGVLIGLFSQWVWGRRQARDQQAPEQGGSFLRVALITLSVFAAAAAAALGLLFSWSRGAWMGFLAGVTLMAVFWPRRLRYGLLVFLIAAVGFLFLYQSNLLPPTIADRLSGFAGDLTFGDVRGVDINDENYSVLERLAHWQAGLDMVRDHPWLGIGFGNYGAAYGAYALINWPDPLGHAHNYYVNILAETGFIGLAAYLLLWGAIFWQTLHVLRREAWPVRGVALGLLGVWTAVTVHHAVDKLYVNNIYIHLGVLLGLLQLLNLNSQSELSVIRKSKERE